MWYLIVSIPDRCTLTYFDTRVTARSSSIDLSLQLIGYGYDGGIYPISVRMLHWLVSILGDYIQESPSQFENRIMEFRGISRGDSD